MEAKEGDKVKVKTDKEQYEGILMPREGSTLVLKLENGYNIGVEISEIKSTEVIKQHKSKRAKKEEIKYDKSLPKVSILHTGGTIASSVDYETGGVSPNFTPEKLSTMFPEIKGIANISSRLIRNMLSENMRFAHYNLIAKEVEKEIKAGAKGIVVTHGTDTMHYTSAALSFMLENLNVPVILVGSQRSSDRGSSDAYLNLLNAVYFAANSDCAEVCICMHESSNDDYCIITPGTKARKMHTSRRDAFRPINVRPWARVNYKEKSIQPIRKGYHKAEGEAGNLKVTFFRPEIKVGILKAHPNMYSEEVRFYKDFDGLVIEAFALGNMPLKKIDDETEENPKIMDAIKEIAKNVVVVASSQAIYGRLDMNVYTEGRRFIEAGALGNYSDMTPETTFIKLAWLLSNYPKEKARELIGLNLRGEISERTENETFLV